MMNLFQMKIEKVENNYDNEDDKNKILLKMNFHIFKGTIHFGGINEKRSSFFTSLLYCSLDFTRIVSVNS